MAHFDEDAARRLDIEQRRAALARDGRQPGHVRRLQPRVDGVHGRFRLDDEADVERVRKILDVLRAPAREDEREPAAAYQEGEAVVAARFAQAETEMLRRS